MFVWTYEIIPQLCMLRYHNYSEKPISKFSTIKPFENFPLYDTNLQIKVLWGTSYFVTCHHVYTSPSVLLHGLVHQLLKSVHLPNLSTGCKRPIYVLHLNFYKADSGTFQGCAASHSQTPVPYQDAPITTMRYMWLSMHGLHNSHSSPGCTMLLFSPKDTFAAYHSQ